MADQDRREGLPRRPAAGRRRTCAAGHTVALASSATRFQAASAAADLDIEHLLVTEIEDDEGILTGRVARTDPVGRRARPPRSRSSPPEQGLDLAESYAYGNGGEDELYLETVGRPRPLNPDAQLTGVAEQRGWPVAPADPAAPAAPR